MNACGIRANIDNGGNTRGIRANIGNAGNIRSNLIITSSDKDTWKGTYTFIPTQYEQRVPVSGLVMENDIIIEKIPDNYGLITYNGSKIRIS